ncbi:hypothetical protein I4F81_010039 [Pyropia yezoensis]|uniref:Uncharacterized protein n=1 Tax=Pyropia yezoensis TaxID=2788 RepID=A0ACC3CBI6_PYRYE|nr:hypothetical protein I4F81_010039 [Neopyropia yezoensis]
MPPLTGELCGGGRGAASAPRPWGVDPPPAPRARPTGGGGWLRRNAVPPVAVPTTVLWRCLVPSLLFFRAARVSGKPALVASLCSPPRAAACRHTSHAVGWGTALV